MSPSAIEYAARSSSCVRLGTLHKTVAQFVACDQFVLFRTRAGDIKHTAAAGALGEFGRRFEGDQNDFVPLGPPMPKRKKVALGSFLLQPWPSQVMSRQRLFQNQKQRP